MVRPSTGHSSSCFLMVPDFRIRIFVGVELRTQEASSHFVQFPRDATRFSHGNLNRLENFAILNFFLSMTRWERLLS